MSFVNQLRSFAQNISARIAANKARIERRAKASARPTIEKLDGIHMMSAGPNYVDFSPMFNLGVTPPPVEADNNVFSIQPGPTDTTQVFVHNGTNGHPAIEVAFNGITLGTYQMDKPTRIDIRPANQYVQNTKFVLDLRADPNVGADGSYVNIKAADHATGTVTVYNGSIRTIVHGGEYSANTIVCYSTGNFFPIELWGGNFSSNDLRSSAGNCKVTGGWKASNVITMTGNRQWGVGGPNSNNKFFVSGDDNVYDAGSSGDNQFYFSDEVTGHGILRAGVSARNVILRPNGGNALGYEEVGTWLHLPTSLNMQLAVNRKLNGFTRTVYEINVFEIKEIKRAA